MKAVIFDKNSPDRLVYTEVDKPTAKENEVLIKIFNSSVNAADYRSMKMGIIPRRRIFGADIAGQVESVGNGVRNFKVGDEVMGDLAACGFGGFAEYVAAPENLLVHKPKGIPFETAASIPLASVTALQALGGIRKAGPGQKVLICGAGGGVGTFAVQLARCFGAKVTAVCSEANTALMRNLGAHNVIDYNKEDFFKSGEHYDLVLAVNGKYPLSAYKRVLVPNGACLVVGGALSQVLKTLLFGRFMSIGGRKIKILAAKPDTKGLELVVGLVEQGKVRPVIDRRYELNETAEAVRYINGGHARGKVVIHVAGPCSAK